MTYKTKSDTGEISTARILARFLIGIGGMSAAFFWTAGTLNWPEAWLYIALQFSFSTAMAVWLKRHDPELLKDRMTFLKSSARSWDKVIMWTLTILSIPFLLLPGLDAIRYQWSSVPLVVKLAAFSGIAAAFLMIGWVMRENTYLSRVVEIQEERGHTVITTGPYQWVRHPMYVGIIIILVCLPLAVGSLWTLPLALPLIIVLGIRTYFEDKTLRAELEGYKEYSEQVPYRLLPGIW